MRYVIYGAGAIGGGIGGRLAQHGQDAILIARGAHLDVMRRDGLRLRTPHENVRIAVTAVGHPSEVDWRGDEVVLLTMKTQDTRAALDDLRDAAGTAVPVICAQNGVENERIAARRFPNVYAMLVNMPATYLEPGEVVLNGDDFSGVLHAGRYPSGVDATIEEACAGLRASGFRSDPDPAVLRLKYAKLLLVNLGNAVQAVCGGSEAPAEPLERLLRAEALAVFAAAGIEAAPADEFHDRGDMRRAAVPGFTRGGGSTWQSLARGTGTIETDYLNGEVMLLGRLHGVPTPANRALQDSAARALRERLAPGTIGVEEVFALARRYGAEG